MAQSKIEAREKADAYYMSTNEHAHVVTMNGVYEWFCHSYFDNGVGEEMRIVYSTWNEK